MKSFYKEYDLFSNHTNLEINSNEELLKENKIKMIIVSDSVPYDIPDEPIEIIIDIDLVIEDLNLLVSDLQNLKNK